MKYIKPSVRTLCVGTAFGESAMLLAAGEKVIYHACLCVAPCFSNAHHMFDPDILYSSFWHDSWAATVCAMTLAHHCLLCLLL